ncbi:hypothetical protein MtrunA17_Chr7g0228711 [Medicago truncatula]|uniref:Uncharacterized protein n=1 Tax=Medicago truncatula TaxID=3880 RepID=A0A396GXT7_MEDTR|nr:hypothetical protein MtrunA17_Chr7g0228711 [Medicago truncatula]
MRIRGCVLIWRPRQTEEKRERERDKLVYYYDDGERNHTTEERETRERELKDMCNEDLL